MELKDKEHQLSTVLQSVKMALIMCKGVLFMMHRHLQFRWSCSSFEAGIKFRGEAASKMLEQTKFAEYEAACRMNFAEYKVATLQMNLYVNECSWIGFSSS